MLIRRLLTYSLLSLVALGGFFGSVHIETANQGHSIVSVSYEGNGVYAEVGTLEQRGYSTTPIPVPPTSTDITKGTNIAIDTLNIMLGFVTLLISPAILFAGWLMSPDWTSGDLFGLRTPMYTLWVTVSNIVYFVYAIMLILIALGTMFGKESFSYKVMLPKLALGILMVPFTWWFVQWTISLSAVVTASVITIPAETIDALAKRDGQANTWFDKKSIPTKITIQETTGTGKIDIIKCEQNTNACVSPNVFLREQSGMYGYMMVYAYSIFKFDQVRQLSLNTDMLKAGVDIIHQGLVGVLMFLVFGLLTLALVAMLLVRAIKLWVYAIFSPLFTFQFVAGAGMMGSDKDTFTLKEFVGLCFVPAIVGLTLSFGLILINAVSSGTVSGTRSTACTAELLKGAGCDLIGIMGSDKNKITRKVVAAGSGGTTTNTIVWGPMTIDFIGKAGASQDPATAQDAINTSTSVLNSAGGVFGTLIIDIIALVFIWMAFMAAKNVSKAVSMAVEPFEKIGQQVGSLAKSIPKYTPIPGLGMSANSLSKVPDKIQAGFETRSNEKAAESALGKLIGLDGRLSKDYAQLKVAQGKTDMSPSALNELQKNVQNIVGTKGTLSEEGKKAMEDWVEILKNNKKNISVGEDKLKDNLIVGGKLTASGEQILLGSLNNSTYVQQSGVADKLVKANPNYVPGTGGTSGASTSIVSATIKITEDGTSKINILNEPIQFKLKKDGTIDGTISGIEGLKDKKAGMKKPEFVKLLQSNGNLTQDAAAAIAAAAEKVPGFFE